jgi:hypothetical protein
VAYHLPYVAQALGRVVDLDGNELTPAGAATTDTAARALYQASKTLMRTLDPHHGPHARPTTDSVDTGKG